MKLKKEFNDPSYEIEYRLDTKDGMQTLSSMPAVVAEEIVKRADSVQVIHYDNGGNEYVVNGDTYFPSTIFELEEGEVIKEYKPTSSKKSGRPTKAELVEEARDTMTNPQLHHAIQEAKKENELKKTARKEKSNVDINQ